MHVRKPVRVRVLACVQPCLRVRVFVFVCVWVWCVCVCVCGCVCVAVISLKHDMFFFHILFILSLFALRYGGTLRGKPLIVVCTLKGAFMFFAGTIALAVISSLS